MTGTDQWAERPPALPAPLVAVDLDAFDANADDLVRRAGGLPVRVASKSVRCRALLDRVLAPPGLRRRHGVCRARGGVAGEGRGARRLRRLPVASTSRRCATVATDDLLRAEVTVTIDSVEHVRWLRDTLGADVVGLGVAARRRRLAAGRARLHLGVRRSPTRTPDRGPRRRAGGGRGRAGRPRRDVLRRPGGRAAGCRAARPRPQAPVGARARAAARRRSSRRCASEVDLRFVNAGGTGSLHLFGDDPVVTELAAGSGLYGPTLFDGYDDFCPRPAMAFALPVVRRPAPGYVTAYGGGYVASGEPGWSRVPTPVRRGLSLVRTEAAGRGADAAARRRTPTACSSVTGCGCGGPRRVSCSSASTTVHLVAGGRLVETRAELPRRGTVLRVSDAWRNWARQRRRRTRRRCGTRATPTGVAAAVGEAAARGDGVRVAGSGHSFTPLVATDGLLLHVDGLSGDRRRSTATAAGARARRHAAARAQPRPPGGSGSPCPTSATSTARRSAGPSPRAPTAPAPGSRASRRRSAG